MEAATTLTALPLFPLGTALFPGGVLPLRIFEVRYLDMIGKCHRQGTPFGVVALTRGSEVQHAPSAGPGGDAGAEEVFYDVGTLARITSLSRPQAGLMEIRCEGLQRFALTRRERLKHGLWIGDAREMPDDLAAAVPPDLEPVARALGNLIDELQQRGVPRDELPLTEPHALHDCGWVANRWCELLGLPLEVQQRLMALDNPLVRLELVGDILHRQGLAI
ncbi:MAG: LON peptidase substrate-binding domain-containing protein [Burkholderiaceae bacterium]